MKFHKHNAPHLIDQHFSTSLSGFIRYRPDLRTGASAQCGSREGETVTGVSGDTVAVSGVSTGLGVAEILRYKTSRSNYMAWKRGSVNHFSIIRYECYSALYDMQLVASTELVLWRCLLVRQCVIEEFLSFLQSSFDGLRDHQIQFFVGDDVGGATRSRFRHADRWEIQMTGMKVTDELVDEVETIDGRVGAEDIGNRVQEYSHVHVENFRNTKLIKKKKKRLSPRIASMSLRGLEVFTG
ncbi:hypothetical protein CAPTEDRAFT_205819 [Capitella teleta]|uniref:Uncharacterized protein n=1 Tax=Capitella teleta TaxID=283909 RepID=R7TCP9_CAPTE|nr:hypothetical protein CAPTEDRAFT_205819 [Capitella teleta]|eukprot:ELT91277.1 hypothetical protein CAPTEDRAFT_205819 [Capitella teleta]